METAAADEDLARFNARAMASRRRRERADRARGWARLILRRAMGFYWLVCVAVIGLGLNRLYPGPVRHLAWAFQDPAMDLDRPFATCDQAHANGYFAIPRGSKGYSAAQDPQGHGWACPPGRGAWPDPAWRFRIIQDRLAAPW